MCLSSLIDMRRPAFFPIVISAACLVFSIAISTSRLGGEEIEQRLIETTFEGQTHDWRAGNGGRMYLRDGSLCVEAVDGEPTLSKAIDRIGGQIRFILRLRTKTESRIAVYWTTRGSPRRGEDKKTSRTLVADGQWRDYEFPISTSDALTGVMIRFEAGEGFWEIQKMSAFRRRNHPILLQRAVPYELTDEDGAVRQMLRYTIFNDASVPITVRIDNLFRKELTIDEPDESEESEPEYWYGNPVVENRPSSEAPPRKIERSLHRIGEIEIPGMQTVDLAVPVHAEGHLAVSSLLLHPDRFPVICFPVFRYLPEGKTDWIVRRLSAERTLEIAPDARIARIKRKNEVVALLAPIIHRDGIIPAFKNVSDPDSETLRFESDEANLEIIPKNNSIRFLVEDKMPPTEGTDASSPDILNAGVTGKLECPAVRLPGILQCGLLPGVEFLGSGDISSSPIDLEPPYQERSVPPNDWLTFPLAVLATEKETALLHWNDSSIQPTFSSPNRFDKTPDHRMSLIGSKIDTTLEFFDAPSEKTPMLAAHVLEHFFSGRDLPEPPPPPRTEEEQHRLCLAALTGPLRSEDGLQWGYAAEPDWPRKPYADFFSTMFRLTGHVADLGELVSGGSDISNDAVFFLLGRIEDWKSEREERIRSYLHLQNPDGSFLYRTRFPEVESAPTSFGVTAVRALEIMEFVRLTGDREFFEAVSDALDYLKQCSVPRGGFFRDAPLHMPDLRTAAAGTWLSVWAYEFSRDPEHLLLAKRFALAGLPFVSLRSGPKTMRYATIPALGGFDRRLPHFFGSAHPRTGIVYAYALNLLAAHDQTVSWKKIARGILHAVEQMQFPDGPAAGCIPDFFILRSQERSSWKINPCSLVSLRHALDGKLDSFSVVVEGKNRYVSPYPLRMTRQGLEAFDVPGDAGFQILQNGNRIITATGSGRIELD